MKICIDAGHYGKYNQSPVVKEYYESQAMWKLHLLQKKYLEQYGFEVLLTRGNQASDMEVTARGKKAKGCDLFLSIHSNASDSESVDYVAVYYLTDDTTTKIDEQSKAIAQKIAPVIAELMGVSQGIRVVTRKSSNDRNGDGLMNDNYYGVLHGTRMAGTPGLILEHSFHTNTRAAKWLLDVGNLDKLARAEADCIAAHYGIKKPDTPDAAPEPDNKAKLTVDGKWGRATTTRLQQIFGTHADGEVSNQWAKYKAENPGLTGGWDWQETPNGKGSQLIKAMQKWAGMPEEDRDGEIGPKTIRAIQKKLGTKQDGYVSYPSSMVMALQRWANTQ